MPGIKIWDRATQAKGHGEKWIRQQYNLAIKSANDRIKTLMQPKYQGRSQAYEYYVKGDLAGAPYVKERGGMTVFKALPKNASRGESLEALRMVERFLSAKTSSARGILENEKTRRDILNDYLKEEFNDRGGSGELPKLTKTEADNVLRWLGSEEGKVAKANYDSGQVREAVAKAVIASRGVSSKQSVSDLYNNWLDSEQALADWIEANESKIGYPGF